MWVLNQFLILAFAILGLTTPYHPKVISRPLIQAEYRDTTITFVVIHYDSSPDVATTIRFLQKTGRAYHYIIGRNGDVYRLLDPSKLGGHAGESSFSGFSELNYFSVGICLNNNGHQPYTTAQYQSLAWVISLLRDRYGPIPDHDIIGHSDIAPGRKKDPGKYFSRDSLSKYLNEGLDKSFFLR